MPPARLASRFYWVCTLIDESESLNAQAAEKTMEALQQALPDLNIALVHGRLKSEEKNQRLLDFKTGLSQLLVATTVIEVGVDIPNASLMVIENPERLGLAQLHQLRGRVGRGHTQSYCLLLYQQPLSQLARERLKIIKHSNDGFEIAEKDLQLRGAGEILGRQQAGSLNFRVAELIRDQDLLPQTKQAAQEILEQQPQIAEKIVPTLVKKSSGLCASLADKNATKRG